MNKYRKHYYNSLPEPNPSFSSTLLDQIYRSIDETNGNADFQRIENWMDKIKPGENNIITKTGSKKIGENKYGSFGNYLNSSWSSSDSSLFSSEADSNYGSSSTTTSYNRPKPIKTSTDIGKISPKDDESGGVVRRSKLKALKMYAELKKARAQPISPGAKLASFLNSLFNNAKKGGESLNTSPACSTSRSCLSKSPGKLSSNGAKRSVRFYPVSVIVDEDCQPCGLKNVALSDPKNCVRRQDQSVEEAARELLRNYQRKVDCQMELEDDDNDNDNDNDDDDDDDGASYASSDLFELDNINNGIHVLGNYMEELPVYETTYLDTNRAIANSLVT